MVRPESAPLEGRIRVIDMRGGSRREHTASQLPTASAASKLPELDLLLETLIDLKVIDVTEHAKAVARSSVKLGDIETHLGPSAQAPARQHIRGKSVNERKRQTIKESSLAERRTAFEKPEVSESRQGAFAWQTASVAKQGESHDESHYRRALEEHSSPARLRVRVTVKKPMVMSFILRSRIPGGRAILLMASF